MPKYVGTSLSRDAASSTPGGGGTPVSSSDWSVKEGMCSREKKLRAKSRQFCSKLDISIIGIRQTWWAPSGGCSSTCQWPNAGEWSRIERLTRLCNRANSCTGKDTKCTMHLVSLSNELYSIWVYGIMRKPNGGTREG
jgi:hypothetical protein